MNDNNTDIESLMVRACLAFGFDTGYHDIWGNYRSLTAATARDLLDAMEIDVSDSHALEKSIVEAEEHRWASALEPCIINMVGATSVEFSLVVDSHLAGTLGKTIGDWLITTDSGTQLRGTIHPQDLIEVDTRQRDAGSQTQFSVTLHLPQALSTELQMGYHELVLSDSRQEGRIFAHTTLIVAPRRCIEVPSTQQGNRHWGLSVQLYSVRSNRNWGIGDFTDLISLIDIASTLGAATVGVNPLHALNLHGEPTPNPYSPNSRHFLNILYLDVEQIAEFTTSRYSLTKIQLETIEALRHSDLVDYDAVIELKMAVLWDLFTHFHLEHIVKGTPRAQAFQSFKTNSGERLHDFAVYEAAKHSATHALPAEADHSSVKFSRSDQQAVEHFTATHDKTIEFFVYLQWQADAQLRACTDHATRRGLPLGLYFDLAVGVTPQSADVWRDNELFATGVEIGAPADDFSPDGQSWGTTPWRPDVLRDTGYQSFINLLRDNMRHARVLRIDHVMGLLRLFWIPRGRSAGEGAYCQYPLDTLLAITALESVRNQCVVVGEDLGSVPDEIRHALWQWGVLSTRIFYFEKYWEGDHAYKLPYHYPDQALISVGSHDLPTLRGFWSCQDLDILSELDRFPSAEFAADRYRERGYDRERLLRRLRDTDLPIPDVDGQQPLTQETAGQLAVALYAWLSQSPSQLLMIQPEDIFGILEQVNVPGTVKEQPNWQRKLTVPLQDWCDDPSLLSLATQFRDHGRSYHR